MKLKLLYVTGALVVACSMVAEAREYTEKHVLYAEPDEHRLYMTLFLPEPEPDEEAALRPTVLLVHGGAWIAGRRHQLFWLGRKLAENGIVAASMDYRKLPRYGFPECVLDAKAALRWLRMNADTYGIDPDRIAVSGHSAGGYIAVMLGATQDEEKFRGTENLGYSDEVQAVISVYGAVDWRVYQGNDVGPIRRTVAQRLFRWFLSGVAEDGMDPFEVASPDTYLRDVASPTLFIHGDRDRLVPIAAAWALHEVLTELGIPSNVVTMNGHGHSFERFRARLRRAIFEEIYQFLDEHMGLEPVS